MGWKAGIGATLPVQVKNHRIYVRYPTGEFSFGVDLNIETEEQITRFEGPGVCWLVTTENRVYIGLMEGTIFIVTKDGYHAGMSTWDAPSFIREEIGYCNSGQGMLPIYVFPFERRFAHAKGVSFVLREPVPDDIDEEDMNLHRSLSVTMEGTQAISICGSGLLDEKSVVEIIQDTTTRALVLG